MSKKGTLFVISGASGAGKTSVVHDAIASLKGKMPIERVITYTTRKPRIGEEHGRDYVFICPSEFKQLEERNFFFETTKFNGDIYASPQKIVDRLSKGISQVITTDIEGIKNFKKLMPSCVSIWVQADSDEELEKRLRGRGTEDEETVKNRIKLAKEHNDQVKNEGLADHILVNKTLEQAVLDLEDIFSKYASTVEVPHEPENKE
ncbi:guanylate kinase [Candidatus Dependentiae bacterium]